MYNGGWLVSDSYLHEVLAFRGGPAKGYWWITTIVLQELLSRDWDDD